jgi:hypothetical protein
VGHRQCNPDTFFVAEVAVALEAFLFYPGALTHTLPVPCVGMLFPAKLVRRKIERVGNKNKNKPPENRRGENGFAAIGYHGGKE